MDPGIIFMFGLAIGFGLAAMICHKIHQAPQGGYQPSEEAPANPVPPKGGSAVYEPRRDR